MMNNNQNMLNNQNMMNSPNMMNNPIVNQNSPQQQPEVVKKYMEQRYGSNMNMAGGPGGGPGTNSPNQQQQQNNGTPKTGLLGEAFGGASNLFGASGASKLFGGGGAAGEGGGGGASNLLSGPANLLGGSANLLGGSGAASNAAGAATAGLNSLKSSFTSGFSFVKNSATSNPITSGFTSKLLNPFSSNSSSSPTPNT